MEYLNEDHLKLLLYQEWLVKVDNDKSTPYLMKFFASVEELSCCLIITDTKNVWGEVLSSKAFARRWRECNSSQLKPGTDEAEGRAWRRDLLGLLINVHSMGGISDLSFDVVPSRNADLAFELGSSQFEWRWEAYTLGPKTSADVLSKQLIMPLISVSHLAFSSADPAIDKAGRTGRRAADTHVKHAISRPRLTTAMRRLAAVFNFLPDLPPVISRVETPEFVVPQQLVDEPLQFPGPPPTSPVRRVGLVQEPPNVTRKIPTKATEESSEQRIITHVNEEQESATEEEDDESPVLQSSTSGGKGHDDNQNAQVTVPSRSAPLERRSANPSSGVSVKENDTSTETSNPLGTGLDDQADGAHQLTRFKRKPPIQSSSDEDNDAEPKRRATQPRNVPRGAKQPIKRGSRRF